ncbi:hypothetical protein B0H17DRAFT_99807 [Mycena rosella]|uniref:Uncharacterized protein n=1 Tax=Mycena rosella TaxID=1033263 RepID=A0AAD7GCV1_MYCRO|nr:hypothetical protein B0H17DRAFT_99807 [Mycena rosella]
MRTMKDACLCWPSGLRCVPAYRPLGISGPDFQPAAIASLHRIRMYLSVCSPSGRVAHPPLQSPDERCWHCVDPRPHGLHLMYATQRVRRTFHAGLFARVERLRTSCSCSGIAGSGVSRGRRGHDLARTCASPPQAIAEGTRNDLPLSAGSRGASGGISCQATRASLCADQSDIIMAELLHTRYVRCGFFRGCLVLSVTRRKSKLPLT